MNREARRKQAKTATPQAIEAFQVPIFLNRDQSKHIGFVTLDPTQVPKGTEWGLQPGVIDGKIVAFSTTKKGSRSSLVQ